MKTCPVCKARCFDDMEICYGCMHRFDEVAREPGSPGRAPDTARPGQGGEPARFSFGADPEPSGRDAETARLGQISASSFPVHADSVRAGESGAARTVAYPRPAGGIDVPTIELAPGTIAATPLGNGYRLVLAIERA